MTRWMGLYTWPTQDDTITIANPGANAEWLNGGDTADSTADIGLSAATSRASLFEDDDEEFDEFGEL